MVIEAAMVGAFVKGSSPNTGGQKDAIVAIMLYVNLHPSCPTSHKPQN
jgi:hypothetical protein